MWGFLCRDMCRRHIGNLDERTSQSLKMDVFAFLDLLGPSSGYGILTMVLFGIIAWWWLRSFSGKDLPPGPFNWPVLGCLHLLGTLPHVSLDKLSKKYGDIFYLRLGTVPFIVISSAEAAKEVYRFHGVEFASKMPTVAGKCGNNYSGIAFKEYTPELKLFRKILNTHLLSATRLKAYEQVRREEQLSLARSILEADTGNPVQVRSILHAMNMNILTNMLFGERYYGSAIAEGLHPDEFVEVITQSLKVAGVFNVGDFIPGIRWMDIQGLKKRLTCLMSRVNEHLLSILQRRRSTRQKTSASETTSASFLDVLISLDAEDEHIPDISKVSIMLEVLVAGVDSSAVSTEWALAELLRHPSKFDRARKEIDDLVGTGRLVEEQDLVRLPYIEAVAKESLRLYPSSPNSLPRILRAPLRLRGYQIPAGTCAIMNFYSLGHDAEYWKDPFDFMPERFLDSNIDIFGQDYNMLPFGSGRRMCPGAKLGFDFLRLGLATLVQGFNWNLPQGQDTSELNMQESYGLVLHKTEPLVAFAEPRLPAHAYGHQV